MPSAYWNDDVRAQEAAAVLGDPVAIREIVEAGLISTQAGNQLSTQVKLWIGTQEDYDALTPVATTIYFIVE